MENILCVLCGRDNTKVLFRQGIFQKGGPVIKFNNVICKNCGLVYRSPRPNSSELNEIYKKIYLEERETLSDEAAALEFVSRVDQKNKGEQIANFLSNIIKPKSKILDVGSGLGLVGGFLRQNIGVEVIGIEPSELSAKVANKIYGMEVFRGTFDDYLKEKNNEKFDCIILHHVFEHFGDPLGKLEQLKNLLAPQGVLYIEVPNVTDFKKPISQFFDALHLYNYSPETLEAMLKKGGYKIIRRNQNKKLRIQIVAAPSSRNGPVIELGEVNSNLARKIIWYCRKKYALERFRFFLHPINKALQKLGIRSQHFIGP